MLAPLVEEAAPDVAPAADLGDARRPLHQMRIGGSGARDLVEAAEAGVAIGMQPAGEVGELGTAVLALAIGRVSVEHGRRRGSAVGALVAQIDPQPAGLGLAGAGGQHIDGRVVGMDDASRHDMRGNQLDQRVQEPRDLTEPFGELAAIDIKARPRIDLGLPIEGQVITELGDDDVGEEARVDHAARNGKLRHRRLHHRLALPAGARRTYVTDHLEARRHVGQHLGDRLADVAQLRPAAGLAHARRPVNDIATWELGRQLATLLPLRRGGFGDRFILCGGRRCGGDRLGLRSLGLLQRQLQLLDGALDALGARRELLALEPCDLGFQLLDRKLRNDEAILGSSQFSLLGSEPRCRLDQPPLQLGNIIGQLIRCERHAHAMRCFALSGKRRRPSSLRSAPFEAFEQHRHLRRGQSDRAFLGDRPSEAASLQPLGEETKALAVPVQNLDEITATTPKAKQVASERVLLQHVLRQDAQAIETLAHVGHAASEVDLHASGNRDHRTLLSSAATMSASASGSIHSSTLTRRPLVSVTSTCAGRRPHRVVRGGAGGLASHRLDAGAETGGAICTGTNAARASASIEMPGMLPDRTCRSHV